MCSISPELATGSSRATRTGGNENGWRLAQTDREPKRRRHWQQGGGKQRSHYFFHANQYYRMSDVFLTIAEESKRAERFRKAQRISAPRPKLHEPEIEVVPCAAAVRNMTDIFAIRSNPKPGKWPAVLFLAARTLMLKKIYFGAKPMLERGWAVLLVDTPGRGSSIYLKGIKTRPDYEVPGKACIDYLVSRSE